MATDLASWSDRAHANLNGAGGAYYNGFVYQVGGSAASTLTTVRYASLAADGTMGAWTATTALPEARHYAGVAVCNGYLYVAGGLNASTYKSTVYYAAIAGDGTVGAWSTGTALPATRGYGALAHDGFGNLLFVGGFQGSAAQTTVWTCTPDVGTGANGSWTVRTALPGGRYAHGLVISGGYAYCIGGSSYGAYQKTVYRTAMSTAGVTGTWTTTTDLPANRLWGYLFAFSGTLYWVAGTNGSTHQQTVYYGDQSIADGSVASWSTGGNPLPVVGTYIAGAVRSNGRVCVFGGSGATYLANEYQTYLPELTVVIP